MLGVLVRKRGTPGMHFKDARATAERPRDATRGSTIAESGQRRESACAVDTASRDADLKTILHGNSAGAASCFSLRHV